MTRLTIAGIYLLLVLDGLIALLSIHGSDRRGKTNNRTKPDRH